MVILSLYSLLIRTNFHKLICLYSFYCYNEFIHERIKSLSTDPFALEVSIDGTLIKLPCQASELEALGYSFKERETTIPTGDFIQTEVMKMQNGNYIIAGLSNHSEKVQAYKDCTIDSISLYDSDCDGQKIEICNGITFGTTADQVKAVYEKEAQNGYNDYKVLICSIFKNRVATLA